MNYRNPFTTHQPRTIGKRKNSTAEIFPGHYRKITSDEAISFVSALETYLDRHVITPDRPAFPSPFVAVRLVCNNGGIL